MNKTKIEWADYTWNPLTGCMHGCEYCYARGIAERFSDRLEDGSIPKIGGSGIIEYGKKTSPFPHGFEPTFRSYKLDEPQEVKKPQNIFVCSMSDLFGNWVPDRWIKEVFEACKKAPQHNYLFLTKNPDKYVELASRGNLPLKHWYGFTLTGKEELPKQLYSNWRTFVSIEPMLAMPDLGLFDRDNLCWVILGAQTGPGSAQYQPKKEWIEDIVKKCEEREIPVLMKDSLIPIVGEDNMKREYPKQLDMHR